MSKTHHKYSKIYISTMNNYKLHIPAWLSGNKNWACCFAKQFPKSFLAQLTTLPFPGQSLQRKANNFFIYRCREKCTFINNYNVRILLCTQTYQSQNFFYKATNYRGGNISKNFFLCGISDWKDCLCLFCFNV